MNSKRKVLENSFLYIISSLLVKAIGFLLLPIYTRLLLPEDYGIMNLVNGFTNVATFIVAFSLYSAVIRFYADYKEDREKLNRFYSTIILFIFFSGIAFIGLGFLIKNVLIKLFFRGISFYPIIFLALLTLLFISMYTVHQNILQSMQKGKKVTIINLTIFFLQVGINLIFIGVLKMGATGVLLSTFIINVGYFIFMIVDLRRIKLIRFEFDRKILKEALIYSIPIMPHNMSTQIAHFATQIFINSSGSLASVGLYGIASQFGAIIDVVQVSVNQAFIPWFYDMMNSMKEDSKKSIVNLSNFLLILYSILYMGIGLFSQEVILLMADAKYMMSWAMIPILVLGYSAKSIYYFYVNILFYYKSAARKIFLATITGSLVDIILSFFLVPYLGLYGAGFSFLIAKIIVVSITVLICRKYNDIGYRVKSMLKIIIPSQVFMGIGLILSYSKYMKAYSGSNFLYKIIIFILYLFFIYRTNLDVIKKAMQSEYIQKIINHIPVPGSLNRKGNLLEYRRNLSDKKGKKVKAKLGMSEIMKECHIHKYISYKIKNGVYYVETEQQRYIVKILKVSLLRKVADYIRRGKCLAFLNEINFYRSLSLKTFEKFHYSRLIHTDGKSFMVLEYISGTNGWDGRVITQQKLIEALLEFQFSGIKTKTNFIHNVFTKLHRNIPSIVIRWSVLIIKSPKDIVTALKCVLITLKQTIMIKKYPCTLVIHNDLFYFNNIITGYNKNIYVYDFEYATEEDKWILVDIIDLCFDLQTLKFNTKLFIEYMTQLSIQPTFKPTEIKDLCGQIRVILIRKVIGVLSAKSIQGYQKMECSKFLKNILLSKRYYGRWYSLNINPSKTRYM